MRRRALDGAKVLLVGGFPPPYGGIAVHVAALREELEARGAQVRGVDVGGRGQALQGVVPARGPLALAAALARQAAARRLVHAHISGHTAKSWLVALACALGRRPLGPGAMLTVHSGLLPCFLARGEPSRALARAGARAFARVVAVNPQIAQHLARIGVDRERLAVAPAFTGALRPGRPPPELDALRTEQRPLLSCAVGPGPVYGLRILFAALPRVARREPRVAAAIFGPERHAEVAALARRYRVEDRVHFLGQLDHAQALATLAASTLFVRPAVADGDAISVREALALGLPVVASAVGNRPEGVALFRNGDPQALAEEILRALAAPRAERPPPEAGLEPLLELYREQLSA